MIIICTVITAIVCIPGCFVVVKQCLSNLIYIYTTEIPLDYLQPTVVLEAQVTTTLLNNLLTPTPDPNHPEIFTFFPTPYHTPYPTTFPTGTTPYPVPPNPANLVNITNSGQKSYLSLTIILSLLFIQSILSLLCL